MSLMSRVRDIDDVPTLAASADDNALERLKEHIQRFVSTDDIAAIMAEQPSRARNELKSACRQAFEDASWAGVSQREQQRLTDGLIDMVFGFGPLESLLADDSVTEIMVNGPSDVFFERDGRLHRSEQRFADEGQLRALIDRVLGPLGRRIDEASPMVNARLPEGHRVHVIIPPLALDGPVMTVRKFAKRVMTLDDMVATGSFDEAMRTFLVWAVRARKSIAVSGGTGSGKTTLLNALSCELPPSERIITIEDSAELRFLEHPHVVRLEARPRNAEGTGEVTIRDLVINALRMRPDRIVVGECRGAEALDMLQAMNTGHDGSLTTLHANSPADVVSRLATMVRYAVDLPVDVIESNVASAFEVVVQTARALDGSRFVSDVAELVYDGGKRCCKVRPLFMREAVGVVDARGLMTTEESLLSVWIAAMVGAGMCAGAAAGSVVCGIAVAVCACACAVVWLRTVQDKRRDALREGIPDALRSMAVCFQAGLSLLQTFQQVASEVQGPLGTLFARAAHQLETGEGAGRALEVLRRGSSVAELAFVAVALDVQHQAGGSMKQVLDAARDTVQSEIELRRALRVQTAQAKLSARVVSVLPFVLIAVFSLVSEGFLDPFFASPMGMALLAIALGMQAAGIVAVRRMLAVEVG